MLRTADKHCSKNLNKTGKKSSPLIFLFSIQFHIFGLPAVRQATLHVHDVRWALDGKYKFMARFLGKHTLGFTTLYIYLPFSQTWWSFTSRVMMKINRNLGNEGRTLKILHLPSATSEDSACPLSIYHLDTSVIKRRQKNQLRTSLGTPLAKEERVEMYCSCSSSVTKCRLGGLVMEMFIH